MNFNGRLKRLERSFAVSVDPATYPEQPTAVHVLGEPPSENRPQCRQCGGVHKLVFTEMDDVCDESSKLVAV